MKTHKKTREGPIDDKDKEEDEPEEFFIEKITWNRVNKSHKHEDFEYSKKHYHVRWYSNKPSEDIWEPIWHIPLSNIISYCKRKKINIHTELDQTISR